MVGRNESDWSQFFPVGSPGKGCTVQSTLSIVVVSLLMP